MSEGGLPPPRLPERDRNQYPAGFHLDPPSLRHHLSHGWTRWTRIGPGLARGAVVMPNLGPPAP